MNKKLIALVVIVIVLGTMLAGCAMFEIDQNRNYHQVVATVNYEGMSESIYRGDVLTYVLNYGGQYIQNYGMTPEQVVEYFYNNLSKQKLLLLYAKYYVAYNGIEIEAVTDKNKIVELSKDNKNFLSVDELRHCIELTNKQFDELWQKNISALEKEAEANKGEQNKPDKEEEKKDDELAARPTKPEKKETGEYENQNVTDPANLPTKFFDKANEKINAESDSKKKNDMRSALSTLSKSLEKNFTDYDYYLNQQMEARIVEKYEKALGKDVEIKDEDVATRYNKLVAIDIAKYENEDTYKAAMETNTFSLYHTNPGYSYVKSILLSFNKTQQDVLKLVKTLEPELAKDFRNDMAMGNVTEAKYGKEIVAMLNDEKADKKGNAGVTINVSNPKYDAKNDELKTAYTDKNVPLDLVLYAMANAIGDKQAEMEALLATANITDPASKQAAINFATKQAFVDWTYLVNDDPGMFQNESYMITRPGTDSTYVEEFTILGRELSKQGVGSYAVPAGTAFRETTLNYTDETGSTEMFKAINGKVATTTVTKDVTSTLKNDKEIKTDIYTLTTAEGNSISYIINDFGIHIILVVDETFDESDTENIEIVYEDEEPTEIRGYKLKLNYILDHEVEVKFKKDAEGKLTDEFESVEVKVKTVADHVKELFKKEKESDLGTKTQVKLFSDETHIVKNEKVYKGILKEFNIDVK